MTKQLKVIADDYANLMRGVADPKELERLEKLRTRDIADTVAVRDRLRNVHGLPDDPTVWSGFVAV